MAELQGWFEPLLWVLGTITVLAAFVRLCKPVWRIFTAPKEFSDKIDGLSEKIEKRIDKIDAQLVVQGEELERLSKQNDKEDSITLSLLHDSIVQIYQNAKETGSISEVSYYRACELYKQNGHSQYIDSIMEALSDMHSKGMVTVES